MGRWWTGYTSISAGRLGIAHSHGEPWLFAATERLQPAYGYGLWKAKIPSEKMCSIAVCRGAGCEVADCLYGNSPTFLDAVEACVGRTALVAVPSETRCWLERPRTADKHYRSKGEARVKRVVEPDSAPCMVATVAASLPASSWYRRKVSEGTKGPITYEFARQRVTLCKEGLPD